MKFKNPVVNSVLVVLFLGVSLCIFASKQIANKLTNTNNHNTDTTIEDPKRLPENGLKGLDFAAGLEVHSFATEPMLKNPTNIDVDERGRVWVTEAYNYRPANTGNPTNPLGDRIMILEDTNGDGKADTAKLFYQGPELNAPLGICVLGNKVIVSQSPYVWVFYDDNGDDKADRKEILFSGIGGEQHDHSVHAFTFGMDGKLYFNIGNEGKTLKDKNGKDVLDQDGDVIGPNKYKQGMVFRCNPDGSNVECLASNFRNPYEVAVDSYGSLWQSDNDDDGNKGVRINYVMPYGNYGYRDEMTGAGWQASRTNIEDSIPMRHWHLNDPGEVPNLLQTGAGSPTGMIFYEGNLLPAQFQNQMIHCDAGPNVVRAYPVIKNGAGYTASIVNVLKSETDQWFRPSDICVAPDGSLIIADWYDPGVGGHQARDQTRGRIYRVAPPQASKYSIPKFDYSTAEGALAALQNPNLSVRYHAYNVLQQMGNKATIALEKSWNTSTNSHFRSRAFWCLVNMPTNNAKKYIQEAIASTDPDLRIIGIRAAKQLGIAVVETISQLVNDSDAQVRRECALALHHFKSAESAKLWAALAAQHDGKDRWYLEALGIGAAEQWDSFFEAYLSSIKDPLKTSASRDIVWRARTPIAVPFLAILASDSTVSLKDRARYFRAFDFNTCSIKSSLLLRMIEQNKSKDISLNKMVLNALDISAVTNSELAQKALLEILENLYGTTQYIDLVNRFEVKSECNNLLKLSLQQPYQSVSKTACISLIQLCGIDPILKIINSKDIEQQKSLVAILGLIGSTELIEILQNVLVAEKYSLTLKKYCAVALGKSRNGETKVLQLLRDKKIESTLITDLATSIIGSRNEAVRKEAATYISPTTKKVDDKKIPTLASLASLKANAIAGKKVFTNYCILCHQANEIGYDFGPNLSEIGSKLPKISLLDAIVHPSAGIGFGYEGWDLVTKDGANFSGIITSKTDQDLEMKFPGGSKLNFKTKNIKSLTQMKQSMMTEGLYKQMSFQDMANLLEYLSGLKKK